MPGPRLRPHSYANHISVAPRSPLNARSTSQRSLPTKLQTWALHPAQAPTFTTNNCYWSSITQAHCGSNSISNPISNSNSHPPKTGVATASLPSSSCIFRPNLLGRNAIARITHNCIENASNCTITTAAATTTTTFSSAKAKLAIRAILVFFLVAAVAASQLVAGVLHFFVQGPTRLAANLIVLLLHHSNLRRTHISSHTSSPFPPASPPIQSHLSPSLPSSLLLLPPLKEDLATSTDLAQASLQTRLPRPDPHSTVPREAVDSSAAFLEPTFPRLPTRETPLRTPTRPP